VLQLPAVAAMVGLTVCLFGLLPRASTAAWGFLAVSVVLAQLGPILQLPAWLQNISPFTHIPQVPVETISPTPLALLTLTAAGLVAAGMAGFAHRDIG
jgi:ABC-2 type transport system permease protein